MVLTNDVLQFRPYLFRIAYNMLGAIEEAEDIVQDVFEKWLSVEDAREPKPYLGRMTVNKSIDRLTELKKQRENYVGPWLPEPYITLEEDPDPPMEYGMLFLLEKLNPFERAVFILREAFGEEYKNIAGFTGLTTDNCRQLLHRAHEKISRSPKSTVDPAAIRIMTEAFLNALHQGDRYALNQLLQSDIEFYSDGGGKRAAALKPLMGIKKVLKFLFGVLSLPENQDDELEYRPVFVNGLPGAMIFRRSDGTLDSVAYAVLEGNAIKSLMYVRNPDKLKIR